MFSHIEGKMCFLVYLLCKIGKGNSEEIIRNFYDKIFETHLRHTFEYAFLQNGEMDEYIHKAKFTQHLSLIALNPKMKDAVTLRSSFCKADSAGLVTPLILVVDGFGKKNYTDALQLLYKLTTDSEKGGCSAMLNVFVVPAANEDGPNTKAIIESYLQTSKQGARFSLGSNFYILLPQPPPLGIKVTKFLELYSVKERNFVNLIQIESNRIDITKLLSEKLSRRQNFHGINIKTTAVVINVTADNTTTCNGPFQNTRTTTTQGGWVANSKCPMTFRLGTVASCSSSDNKFTTHEVKFVRLSNGRLKFQSGSAVRILRFLKKSLNFSDDPVPGEWPEFNGDMSNPNSTSSLVDAHLADICITQTILTPGRGNSSFYLQPTYLTGTQVFFMQPPSRIRDIYLSRFEFRLWIFIAFSWLLIISCLKFCVWANAKFNDFTADGDAQISENSVLWAIGANSQQGWHVSPESISAKITVITGSLTGLICFTAFSASIVSTLSVKFVPIRDIDDLWQSQMEPMVDDSLENFYEMVRDSSSVKWAPWKYINLPRALPSVHSGQSYIVTWPENFYSVARSNGYCGKDSCTRFSQLPISVNPIRSSMFLRKGSPFREIFNYKIMLMKEIGINVRITRQHFRDIGVIVSERMKSKFIGPLGVGDVFLAYIVLISGYLSSGIVLLLEILTAQIQRECSKEYFIYF